MIDHHDTPGDLEGVPFVDIRSNLGATCSLVTKYMIEQNVSIPEKVATALLYGIETEVTGYPREAGAADDEALLYLYPLADKDTIAQIHNARLPQSHFECMLQALQSSFIYDRLIISWVDELRQPDHAAEVVDFMIRFEKVDWAVCGGIYQDKLILSVRAAIEDARAGETLRQVVGKLGRAGGHDRRAGGCIWLPSTAPERDRRNASRTPPSLSQGVQDRRHSRSTPRSPSRHAGKPPIVTVGCSDEPHTDHSADSETSWPNLAKGEIILVVNQFPAYGWRTSQSRHDPCHAMHRGNNPRCRERGRTGTPPRLDDSTEII